MRQRDGCGVAMRTSFASVGLELQRGREGVKEKEDRDELRNSVVCTYMGGKSTLGLGMYFAPNPQVAV